MRRWEFLFFTLIVMVVDGCGYTLHQSKSALLETNEIKRIYIAPLSNDSYKAGVENLLYNEVLKVFASNGRVEIVTDSERADATLSGTVSGAGFGPGGGATTGDKLFPSGTIKGIEGSADVVVAREYVVTLSASFALSARKGGVVWSGGFNRTKPVPATAQMGSYGTTAALINESEFDRGLRDLAQSMVADLHESMLMMF